MLDTKPQADDQEATPPPMSRSRARRADRAHAPELGVQRERAGRSHAGGAVEAPEGHRREPGCRFRTVGLLSRGGGHRRLRLRLRTAVDRGGALDDGALLGLRRRRRRARRSWRSSAARSSSTSSVGSKCRRSARCSTSSGRRGRASSRTALGLLRGPSLAPAKVAKKGSKPSPGAAPAKSAAAPAVARATPARMPKPALKRPAKPPLPADAPRFHHPKFGDGTLEARDGVGPDAKLTIRFEGGSKTLLATYVTELPAREHLEARHRLQAQQSPASRQTRFAVGESARSACVRATGGGYLRREDVRRSGTSSGRTEMGCAQTPGSLRMPTGVAAWSALVACSPPDGAAAVALGRAGDEASGE